ncbi:MAG: hypothetical protein EOO65_02325, partial [Methanosarcinales archaeon]
MLAKLQPIHAKAQSVHDTLKAHITATTTAFDELCRFLGEDPAKTNTETMFGIMQSFLSSFNQEAKAARERQARMLKSAAAKSKQDAKASPVLSGAASASPVPGVDVSTTPDSTSPAAEASNEQARAAPKAWVSSVIDAAQLDDDAAAVSLGDAVSMMAQMPGVPAVTPVEVAGAGNRSSRRMSIAQLVKA